MNFSDYASKEVAPSSEENYNLAQFANIGFSLSEGNVVRSASPRPDVVVIIGGSDQISCELLTGALNRCRNYHFHVAASALNCREVLARFRQHEPDIALIDSNLREGPLAGFKVLRELRATKKKARVIMMLDSRDRDLVIDAFRGGASGVFCRAESLQSLCKCVHAVHKGQIWANSHELQFILDALAEAAPLRLVDAKGVTLLTKRQQAVVNLVAEGLKNSEISHNLSLSEHTVKNYLFRVFEKLGISSRSELILYALSQRERSRTLSR